jgi:Fe-S oxidoreductase
MAAQVGAQVIVTACPFCLINLEDAVKTTGNEGKIEVIDLVELVDKSAQYSQGNP